MEEVAMFTLILMGLAAAGICAGAIITGKFFKENADEEEN